MPGIILNLEEQFYRDYLTVRLLEAGRSGRIAVNAPPPAWDTDYEHWQPGDQITDADAATSGRPSPIWTITHIDQDRVYFDVGGKIDMTRALNLVRLQERKG